ncbi:type VII secretion-associated serine protease mycosin [Streptomyces daghestanicus]|uniref:Type VII secretion-associated serine protease n=1 Tax=Streptomyces daghestanicus TaxID=66885 RepID=A0ABQ3Q045_9ACTN|nr:type VII secretion-associated serine protease mycosin [Streptomyces daghestanicus]GGU64658.1 type VII secretion-associated serine protease [Streptomyces daghestanicus]GHI30619.1 type VII secretion-associated serine protease [Streptomyces daghestanicus]
MAFMRSMSALGATTLAGALILSAAPVASADEARSAQWALETLQAEQAWSISKGEGVTVAVIDDGVNASHIDLQGNVLEGHDFVDGGSATPDAGDDHGTAMASIIAAHGHGEGEGVIGLAPEAKILPIRDFEANSNGLPTSIRYAVDQGASIINVSQCFGSSSAAVISEVTNAVQYALSRDVLVIGGSGNDGDSAECYPGASPGALGVGAVTSDGTVWEKSNHNPQVALTAPGVKIVAAAGAGNRYRMGSGTSDATAYVSAAAALIRSAFPDLTAGQVANRLVKTASLPDSAQGLRLPDEKYGYGAIRPYDALADDIPAGSKYGPLKTSGSQGSSVGPGVGKTDSDYAAENKKADQKRLLVFGVLGLIGLVVVGLIVWLIVRSARRNRNGPGGPASPGGYPQYGQQSAPPQYNPYQQPAQPQQNPYQQQPPSPPQG